MSSTPAWLPLALALADFPDMVGLETAAFTLFQTAWASYPTFRGDEVRVHRHPHLANSNRWNTYWHCVTEGDPETTRITPIPGCSPWVNRRCPKASRPHRFAAIVPFAIPSTTSPPSPD